MVSGRLQLPAGCLPEGSGLTSGEGSGLTSGEADRRLGGAPALVPLEPRPGAAAAAAALSPQRWPAVSMGRREERVCLSPKP